MIVYIEDIFFQSFLTYGASLFLTSKMLHENSNKTKIICASFVTSIIDIVAKKHNLATFGNIFVIALNVLLGVLVVIKGLKRTFLAYILEFCFIFLIDGLKSFLTDKVGVLPWYAITFLLCGFVWFVCKMIYHFYKVKKHKKFEYKITFYNKENVFSSIAYLDSGNFLEDDITKLPIVIIDYNTFLHISNFNIEDILKNSVKLDNMHYVNYSTISGSQKMMVFSVDCVEIDGEKKECLLGLNLKGFGNGYSALLGVNLV